MLKQSFLSEKIILNINEKYTLRYKEIVSKRISIYDSYFEDMIL
ncbi:hypothetical protein SPETJ133_00730 [Staphylococcus petrasii]